MAELDTFPKTPFINDLPLDPTGTELLRTAYLVEDYAQGNPWMRTHYRDALDLAQFGEYFSAEQIDALPDSIESVNRLVRNGASEFLLTNGGLIADDAKPKDRSKQLKAVDETWRMVSERAHHITSKDHSGDKQSAEEQVQAGVFKLGGALAAVGVLGTGIALLDIHSMRNHQKGAAVGRAESTMRENILAGRPSESVAFNPFFQTLNAVALKLHAYDEGLNRLEAAWTALRPSEPFYPEAFLEKAAGKQPMSARLIGKTAARLSKMHVFSATKLLDV